MNSRIPYNVPYDVNRGLTEASIRRSIRRELEIYQRSPEHAGLYPEHAGLYLAAWVTREPRIAYQEIPPSIIVSLMIQGYLD
jgi:hypothetical protein